MITDPLCSGYARKNIREACLGLFQQIFEELDERFKYGHRHVGPINRGGAEVINELFGRRKTIRTAIGLIVAIPAVVAYNFFQRQVKQVLLNLQSAKDLCVAYTKSGGAKGGVGGL